MSFSDINRERGVGLETQNSDIHDLYEDFSSVNIPTNTRLVELDKSDHKVRKK